MTQKIDTPLDRDGEGLEPSAGSPLRGASRLVLHLTLHRKWFDAIASGEKREEFRVVKPFWTKRFVRDGGVILYDEVHFRNGYAKAAPFMRVEWSGLADLYFSPLGDNLHVYVIRLGRILELRNYPPAGLPAPEASSPKGKEP